MSEEVMQSLNVKQLVIGSYSSANLPPNAADGTIVINTTTNKLNIRVNGSWEAVTSA